MEMQENVSLKSHNSFGIDVNASLWVEVTTREELIEVLKDKRVRAQPSMILGGGSNVLFTRDFDGVVIKMNILGKEVLEEDEHMVLVNVGAGENWHELVLYSLDQGWGGLENLSLIPGTVGAAPMQNIGAYGVEVRQVFDHLTAVHREKGRTEIFDNEACKFGYRESVFKNKYKDHFVITHVAFRLSKKDHELDISYGAISQVLSGKGIIQPTIQDVSDAVISIRQSKLPDPDEIGNAGSFFKNPTVDKIDFEGLKAEFSTIPGYELPGDRVKVPAGWLIEQAGWKGVIKGNIGVHKNQALVLVNYGNGQGEDLKALALEIQDSVAKKFGIILTPEVNMV